MDLQGSGLMLLDAESVTEASCVGVAGRLEWCLQGGRKAPWQQGWYPVSRADLPCAAANVDSRFP